MKTSEGSEIQLVRDLAWDLKQPCADCPFLKSSPFHAGVAGSIPEYWESIEANRFAHTCHKTDNRQEVDGPRNHDGQTQHCAGALIMLLKTGNGVDLQLPLLEAAEAGKLNLEEWIRRAKKDRKVFKLRELIAFYGAEVPKRFGSDE